MAPSSLGGLFEVGLHPLVIGQTQSHIPCPEGDENDLAPDTPKMLKVAEQCLERAKSSVSKIGEHCFFL